MRRHRARALRQAAAGLGAALLGALLLGTASAAEPLRLCADPENLPFSSDQPASPGLYVEIGRAVAAALGRPVETVWSLSYFGKRNLRETLLAGHCDLAVGLPDAPDFMGPRVIFSHPILDLGYALLTPRDRPAPRLADLRGKRVAVQFASPPQSLLATQDAITMVTALSPEEAVQALAEGRADAAFIWGPSAGYLNHTVLHDADVVTPVAGPGMQWRAAIGFARTQAGLRDAVDAVLPGLSATIAALAGKYGFPAGAPVVLADAGEDARAVPTRDAAAPAAAGRALFNGTCAHCHGPDAVVAERRINLRLLQHRYGDTMAEVFHVTVTHGRPAKGMPNWTGVFSEQDFTNILAFLRTVQTD